MANIFFGISSEDYVKNRLDKWIGLAGPPDVFSERPVQLKKYKTKFLNEYTVLSIDEALQRYPDATVWVTFTNTGWVPNWLVKKMPPERIRFLEADLEYRKGCEFLGNHVLYRDTSISPCCSTGQGPIVNAAGSVDARLKLWEHYTTKLIDAVQHGGSPNNCQKCHLLTDGFWRKSIKLNSFTFEVNNLTDICNFRCIYCRSAKHLDESKVSTENYDVYNVLKELSELPQYNTEELSIRFGNGEINANERFDEIIELFNKTNWKMNLYSNCSIYKEQISELMEKGRVRSLITSIDAGTRETFHKVKQRDMFDKVVENLKKYPLDKTHFVIKYVFLDGVNDNETDVDGFYKIAKETKGIIMLSSDHITPYTEKMKEMAMRIISQAKRDNIRINTSCDQLHPNDAKFMREFYANA